jgi:hypothetical protein
MRALAISAIVIAALAISHPRAQDADAATAAVVAKASLYVEAYGKAFSALTCEEQQVQKLVRADGRVHQKRELKSAFLMVKLGDAWMGVAFRDVLEVDRKPVRNHDDRLRKLFLEGSREAKTAVEQARAISKESQRYNIGLSRTGNSPMLPIMVLDPHLAPGFKFNLSGSSLAFNEFKSPSYLSYGQNGVRHDLMSHGSFVVDTETGHVLIAEITADAPPTAFYSTTMSTRYRDDAVLKMMVPVDMSERYWQALKPKEDHLEVTSTYSDFKRFQVTTTEKIKAPR